MTLPHLHSVEKARLLGQVQFVCPECANCASSVPKLVSHSQFEELRPVYRHGWFSKEGSTVTLGGLIHFRVGNHKGGKSTMSDWITDSQDEQTLEELLRDADQIHIPIFQRSYVWKQKQLEELAADIELIRSEVETSQFLGAIVAFERPRLPGIVGRLRALAVVDGQQRLLTLYMVVMALTEHLAELDPDAAYEIVSEFLLLPMRRGLEINTRIVPAFADRSQFRVLWDRLIIALREKLGENVPHLPPPKW